MLYKVTPMLPAQPKTKKVQEPGQPRKRRRTAIYDGDGHEVLITLMCLKCKSIKPLMQFGLRKMPDGAIRNQPWCRTCRGGAGQKPKPVEQEPAASVEGSHAIDEPDTSPLLAVAEPEPEPLAAPSPP